MILFKDWGKHLRLGNFGIIYMGLLGISNRYNCKLCLPLHYMWKYFKDPPCIDTDIPVDLDLGTTWEPNRDYWDNNMDNLKTLNCNIKLNNFFQSEINWEDQIDFVRQKCLLKENEILEVKDKYSNVFSKETLSVSIRRGDMVGHGQYEQLPIEYFLGAIEENYPSWQEMNILITSDDIEWCKRNFKGENLFFAEPNNTHINIYDDKHYHNNPFEHLILITQCENFVLSSSTFSWLGAYWAESYNAKKIVCPNYYFSEESKKIMDDSNYYPERWIKFDHINRTISKDIKQILV